jgi:[ribosomal protein S18]-alanine N-acetyltransferase
MFQKGMSGSVAEYNDSVAIVIREYRAEDFNTLWHLDQKCFAPGIAYSKRELKGFIGHKGVFALVAIEAHTDEIVGFIVVHGAAAGHIITIDVSPQARRSGVGSLLIGQAEKRLQAAGSRTVGLETAVDNSGALKFYKRHGYSIIRTWPRYYANGVDALVLEKELARQ